MATAEQHYEEAIEEDGDDPAPAWRPPGLPVRGLPFSVTIGDLTEAGTSGAVDWRATARLGLSGANRGLLAELARDGTLQGLLLSLEREVLASGLGGAELHFLFRAGLRLRVDPGAVSLGGSYTAGIAGPLSVHTVRTASGYSTRLGRPGTYLETEIAISSPDGALSGSAKVRVDLAPRPPSIGDAVRVVVPPVVVWVVKEVISAAECVLSRATMCPATS